MTASALAFDGITKAFGAVKALTGVSFEVVSGEAHAVVGENGAGKSTLLKILAGIQRPDAGAMRLGGEVQAFTNPREALERGIGMVYQEMLAFPNLTVAGNIFAGRELTTRWGRLDERAMRERTRALLADLHLNIDPDTPMDRLSTAHAQLIQVARALVYDCRVLVLDEPTTSLTDAEVDHLFSVVERLKTRGVTILFVSHRLPEVWRLCDRITVLRDGQYVGTFEKAGTTPADIVRAMVGREPPERLARTRTDHESDAAALTVTGLSNGDRVHDVSLSVRKGEIVGVFGLVGSGRTELLEALFGLATDVKGRIEVNGRVVAVSSPGDAVHAGLALVPEERSRQGLHFNLSICDNLALPSAADRDLARIDSRNEAESAATQIAALAIKTPSSAVAPDALSGGNQQKVVLGKWLATRPSVLLLDEPTKGVDVGAKFEIHNLIRREADAGMACVVVSSDLPEILAVSDRILVMREGHIRGELSGADATEESVMRLATHEVTAA
ncbi:MAG: ribose import ATP-binding protein RbsA 1 [Acidimicrobiia bacterium]